MKGSAVTILKFLFIYLFFKGHTPIFPEPGKFLSWSS